MIDFHSNILFSESSTSGNLKKTMELAKAASKAGFTKLIATPRFMYQKDFVSTYDYDLKKCEYLNSFLRENNVNVQIVLGSEIDFSSEVIDYLKRKEIATINDTEYILVRFYENCSYYTMIDGVFKLQVAGYRVIVSQIEKYDFIIENPDMAKELILRDILLQMDVRSIEGYHGNKIKKTAKTLLKSNRIHTLGTHASTPDDYSKVKSGLSKIQKIIGKESYEEITTNGKQILTNVLVAPSDFIVPQKSRRRGLYGFR